MGFTNQFIAGEAHIVMDKYKIDKIGHWWILRFDSQVELYYMWLTDVCGNTIDGRFYVFFWRDIVKYNVNMVGYGGIWWNMMGYDGIWWDMMGYTSIYSYFHLFSIAKLA